MDASSQDMKFNKYLKSNIQLALLMIQGIQSNHSRPKYYSELKYRLKNVEKQLSLHKNPKTSQKGGYFVKGEHKFFEDDFGFSKINDKIKQIDQLLQDLEKAISNNIESKKPKTPKLVDSKQPLLYSEAKKSTLLAKEKIGNFNEKEIQDLKKHSIFLAKLNKDLSEKLKVQISELTKKDEENDSLKKQIQKMNLEFSQIIKNHDLDLNSLHKKLAKINLSIG